MASKDTSETLDETKNTTSKGAKSKSGKYNLRRKTLVVRKETEKRLVSPRAPKPKSRPPPLSKYRRRAANSRERGRMQEINIAFQELQTVLPVHCLPEIDPKTGITKITTLRLAVNYIAALRGVLGEDSSTPSNTDKPCTSAQGEDTVQSVSVAGTPEHVLGNEQLNINPSQLSDSANDCHRSDVSEQSCNTLDTLPVVSHVPEESCKHVKLAIAEEPTIHQDDTEDVPRVLEPVVVPCHRELSACSDQPCKQSAELYQTDVRYEKIFQGTNTVDIELRDQLLVNNSDVDLLQQSDLDIVHNEEETLIMTGHTEKVDVNLNIDANNNERNFDTSSLPLTGSAPFKDVDHHFVPACISWMDTEACSMDADSIVDTQDTDMDIDTELLEYPDIIRAVINDQFD